MGHSGSYSGVGDETFEKTCQEEAMIGLRLYQIPRVLVTWIRENPYHGFRMPRTENLK